MFQFPNDLGSYDPKLWKHRVTKATEKIKSKENNPQFENGRELTVVEQMQSEDRASVRSFVTDDPAGTLRKSGPEELPFGECTFNAVAARDAFLPA